MKRQVGQSSEVWQVYSPEGELLAEYPKQGAASAPVKEYGYRGGQMLVVFDSTETNVDDRLKWLVVDHLGSTRMLVNKSGSLTGMKRRDYLPFGEELAASVGHRAASGSGYQTDDKPRQKFGSKERDNETGLDYFGARYYASVQGRFTSVDPRNAGARREYPQSWNGYSYVINHPLKYSDPNGQSFLICDTQGHCNEVSDADAQKYTFNRTYQQQNGYYTKNDGNIYNTQGQVIGKYTNLGDDRWSPWQRAVVRETARQLDDPAVKVRAAINVLSGRTGTQSLTSRVTSIAEKFRLFQCNECAEAIVGELQREGIHGELIEINAGYGNFMLTERTGVGQTITTNGRHLGVKIGDTVYDNIYTEGIPYQEWVTKFEARGGVQVTSRRNF